MPVNRTLTMYHVTLEERWFSILQMGILTRYSRDRRAAVWLVKASQLEWAINHVQTRYNAPRSAVMVFELSIRRASVIRRARGVWFTVKDIPPQSLKRWFLVEERKS